jgi:hypothetical protein
VADAPLYLTEAETAKALRISSRTLARWRVAGGGPPFARLSARRIAYPVDGLKAWGAGRTFSSLAAEGAGRPIAAPGGE